jgi:hypothetical protein
VGKLGTGCGKPVDGCVENRLVARFGVTASSRQAMPSGIERTVVKSDGSPIGGTAADTVCFGA